MSDLKKIDKSRKLLGLGETASLKEIKDAYRKMALKYHPDKCGEKNKMMCKKKFCRIKNAHEVLNDYCLNWKFSFKEKDIRKRMLDAGHDVSFERFYSGWMKDVDG